MDLSKFLKEQRNLTKLTQVTLADKAGVGIRFVSDLEQGKKTLRMDKVNQVLGLFGHTLGTVPMAREFYFEHRTEKRIVAEPSSPFKKKKNEKSRNKI